MALEIHKGALNLNSLAIIGQDQIIQQVNDQLDIDGTIYRSKQLLEMAKDPASYLNNRTAALDEIKRKIAATVAKTITAASNNGVPEEVRNYMAFEAAKQEASMQRLLIDFQFPMSNTAVKVTLSGKADMTNIGALITDADNGWPTAKRDLKTKGILP